MKKTNMLVTVPTLAALSLSLLAGSPAMAASTGEQQSFTQVGQSQTAGQSNTSNQAINIELAAKVTKSSKGGKRYVTANLNLRSGPSASNKILTTIPKGKAVTWTGKSSGSKWVQVKYSSKTGWVSRSYLGVNAPAVKVKLASVTKKGGKRYTTANLNLRFKPSTSVKVATVIPKGKAVTWTGKTSGSNWVAVKYGSTTGWVSRSYLGVNAPAVKIQLASLTKKGGKRYTAANAHLRFKPSASAKVATIIPKGKAVTWTGKTSGSTWVAVKYGSITGWVSRGHLSTKPTVVAVKRASSTTRGMAAVVSAAKRGVGKPYVYGGKTPNGWDCSGFTAWAYAQAGYSIPSSTRTILSSGQFKKTSNPQPGDLVFQNNNGHVGIYIGSGNMIGAQNPTVDTILHKVTRNPLSGYYTLKNK